MRDRGEDLQLATLSMSESILITANVPCLPAPYVIHSFYIFTFPLVFIVFFLFNPLGTKGKINLFVLILHTPCPHVQSSLKIKQHDLGQLGVCHLGICHRSGNELPVLCMLMPIVRAGHRVKS